MWKVQLCHVGSNTQVQAEGHRVLLLMVKMFHSVHSGKDWYSIR